MEEPQMESEEESQDLTQEEAVDTLTAYFRRTSRGRIVELPRWAQ